MKRRLWASLLALILILGLTPAAGAAEAPAQSGNKNRQNYSRWGNWAQPVTSYLYENEKGGLTRVEYTGGQVVVEDYDSSFVFQSGRTIQPELPIWGGFFAGADYNFLIFGQENPGESDSVEVIRVVKYSKDWQRLGAASLKGANTTVPFDAGSLRCAECNGYLYLRTCHEMYASDDGLNHQANLTMAVRQGDMAISDSYYDVMNINYGYVSHSFNQFLLIDREERLVTLDHGDAYPRSIVLCRYNQKAGQGKFTGGLYSAWCSHSNIVEFPGQIGDNVTGATVGGLAETQSCYVIAYNYDGVGGGGDRIPYFCTVDKSSGKVRTVSLDGAPCTTPVLASTGPEGGYVLWDSSVSSSAPPVLHYAQYGADGALGALQTASAPLSDCAPIPYRGQVVWYVTDSSAPVFYLLDASGITALDPAAPRPQTGGSESQPPADSGTAYASSQQITVDGRAVTMDAYALKDADGNDSNYLKLRDVAYLLNGTAAQFQVGWDGGVTITTGTAYTPNGSELSTPFSGDQPYTPASAATRVDGEPVELPAILLKDASGTGFTYYRLRDLGEALNFYVGWSQEQGIYLDTTRPYEG